MAPAFAPRYIHDSDCCTFLGYFGKNDLYVCPQSYSGTGTYIARASSDPSDYNSGAAFVGLDYAITHAHLLAVRQHVALTIV